MDLSLPTGDSVVLNSPNVLCLLCNKIIRWFTDIDL